VSVDTLVTVQGTLAPGPGNPQAMDGMSPTPGPLRVIVPESSPFNPQALSGDVTWRPVISTEGPAGEGELLERETNTTKITMRNTTNTTSLMPQ